MTDVFLRGDTRRLRRYETFDVWRAREEVNNNESYAKYLSVCVGFLYTPVVRRPSSIESCKKILTSDSSKRFFISFVLIKKCPERRSAACVTQSGVVDGVLRRR